MTYITLYLNCLTLWLEREREIAKGGFWQKDFALYMVTNPHNYSDDRFNVNSFIEPCESIINDGNQAA